MLARILAHQTEAADSDLLDAIMDRLDAIIGLGPVASVLVLSGVILAIPVGLLGLYAWQRRRSSAWERQNPHSR